MARPQEWLDLLNDSLWRDRVAFSSAHNLGLKCTKKELNRRNINVSAMECNVVIDFVSRHPSMKDNEVSWTAI